ncbi:hypothetical protein NQ318_015766 [Aromia moschata]|uniref:Uncharacterized protein n=1 Tax=Aromia moschata TaxID=1265417 RepID=A0AAV8XN49_9CUCU|nr:hypothetical protein NQ318_015766 [Aromia moschata]
MPNSEYLEYSALLHWLTFLASSKITQNIGSETLNWDTQYVYNIFGVNLDNSTVNVRIDGLFEDEDSVETIYAYELTSDSLHSKTVYLNEEPLNLTEDYDLPELLPKYVSTGSPVTMPPYSIVFWVIPTTDVSACL